MKHGTISYQALSALLLLLSMAVGAAAQQDRAAAVAAKDEAAIRAAVNHMQEGWNTKSGALFAKPFADDADYVVINGMHVQGREAIEKGHQQIFDTIYKNTTISLKVKQIRLLRPDVAVVHVLGRTKTPQGDAVKESDIILTLVMTKDNEQWTIKAFQNTRVDNQPKS